MERFREKRVDGKKLVQRRAVSKKNSRLTSECVMRIAKIEREREGVWCNEKERKTQETFSVQLKRSLK